MHSLTARFCSIGLLFLLPCVLGGLCPEYTHAEPPVNILCVSSGRTYTLGIARKGVKVYTDRKFVLTQLPSSLAGKVLLRTSNEDDRVSTREHLRLRLRAPTTLYVCLDARSRKATSWLEGWKQVEHRVATNDTKFRVYRQSFAKGTVTLGGNERSQSGAMSNYFVILVPGAAPENSPLPVPSIKVSFAKDIRPLLERRCFRCHGADRQKGGLRLDIRRRAFLGGDSGPAVVAGSQERSLLLRRVLSKDPEERMPPRGRPLSTREVTLLRAWIARGARWPDSLAGKEKFSEHWAYQPIQRSTIPATRNTTWIRNPIDAFILARLEQKGLKPAPAAAPHTLIRRLHLDLLGLPPSPEEVDTFCREMQQDPDAAVERLVDRLLASPHFGERWGRHWLDLARFAESDGYENDRLRPHAWRWRDWVINAFNRDLPFDQFTIEQLAGDLLPGAITPQRIATGFHRNTLWNSAASADKEEFRLRAIKDRTDTTATVWMGLTLGCAKCHSHKYDPISQREYYQLFAFFNNTDNHDIPVPGGKAQVLKSTTRTSYVHKRGNFLNPGIQVSPGTPAFLPPMRSTTSQTDRLAFARWLVHPGHPLTARVAVNRYWQHLFGRGLVGSPENFGVQGQKPSHPHLLDWLASELIAQRWSRKRLLRTIVLSATYRQSSHHRPELAQLDPDNRLLARQHRFRVEAEVVRDLALAVTGQLERTVGGPSIVPPFPRELPQGQFTSEALKRPGKHRLRRGMYIHVQRTLSHPSLATFDVADGNECCPRRDRSCTPLQALTLLNDPTFTRAAHLLGARLRQAHPQSAERLTLGFRLCLGRQPSSREQAVLLTLVDRQRKLGAREESIWQGVARVLLNLEEFITRE